MNAWGLSESWAATPGAHQERSLAALERARGEVRMITRMIVGPAEPLTPTTLILLPITVAALAYVLFGLL